MRALARARIPTEPDLEISVLRCKTRSMMLDLIRTTDASSLLPRGTPVWCQKALEDCVVDRLMGS